MKFQRRRTGIFNSKKNLRGTETTKNYEKTRKRHVPGERDWGEDDGAMPADLLEAENILAQLANVFFFKEAAPGRRGAALEESDIPGVTDVYRILVEAPRAR